MSAEPRLWLPLDAFDCGRVRDAVRAAVAAWSGKWIAGGQARAGGFEARAGAAPMRAGGWRAHCAGVHLALGAPETIRLAGLALGAEPDRLVLSEVDRDIIARLTQTVATDLAATLAATLGLPSDETGDGEMIDDPFDCDGGLLFSAVDDHERPLLHGAVPRDVLVPFRKAGITPRRSRAPMSRMARAIDASDVRVGARLGNAVLALGDLAGLGPGDVLMLDRAIADGAELTLGPTARPFAHGKVAQDDGAVSLTLSLPQRET